MHTWGRGIGLHIFVLTGYYWSCSHTHPLCSEVCGDKGSNQGQWDTRQVSYPQYYFTYSQCVYFFKFTFLSSWNICLRVKLVNHIVFLFWIFKKILLAFFHLNGISLYSQQQWMRAPLRKKCGEDHILWYTEFPPGLVLRVHSCQGWGTFGVLGTGKCLVRWTPSLTHWGTTPPTPHSC